jgi:GR25 family glycosyltransferase involved in LPS biosynthesis
MLDNIDIFVLATKKRNPLITPHLDKNNINYELYYTPDYVLDNSTVKHKEYTFSEGNLIAHYRIFKGHQDVMRKINKDYALIFEDDAVPNCKDWVEIIEKSLPYCNDYDFVSLHARNINMGLFETINTINNRSLLKPKQYGFWVSQLCGCMAYLIKKDKINCYVNDVFNGTPDDVTLYSKQFVLLEPTIFNHDNGQETTLK